MPSARLLLAIFVVFQVADGLITYGAIQVFGLQAEGNPLLVTWMQLAGPAQTLLGAKVIACACGAILYILGLLRVLGALTLLYLTMALIPWLRLLSA